MPPPPPPREACERAWELYSTGIGWRQVAKILTADKMPCSYETARRWGFRGKKLYASKKDIDPRVQVYRVVDGIEQDIADLRALAADPDNKVTILDIMPELKWLYRERARAIGTDFRPVDAAARESVEPQPFIQRMVNREVDPEELYGEGNGHR